MISLLSPEDPLEGDALKLSPPLLPQQNQDGL